MGVEPGRDRGDSLGQPSGFVFFPRGARKLKRGIAIAPSSAATTTFVASGNANNPTLFGYDEIGRQTSINVPDGTPDGIVTATGYSIVGPATNSADILGDGLTWLRTEVLDGNAFAAG